MWWAYRSAKSRRMGQVPNAGLLSVIWRMTVPPPEPDPAIDPDESVPDDPAELLPDAPEPLPPAPIESTPDDPGGDTGGVPEPA